MIDINRDSDFRIIFTHKKLLNFQNRRIFYFRNRLYRRYLSLICLLFSEIVTVMINWQQDFVSSNCVCNHTRDSQIRLQLRGLPILLITRMITERIGLHSVLLPLFIISIIIVIIIITYHYYYHCYRYYYMYNHHYCYHYHIIIKYHCYSYYY